MFGPDAKASLEIDDVERLVKGVKQIKDSLKSCLNKNELVENMENLKNNFGKSLCVNKDLPENHVIGFDDLEAKKPYGYGIPPCDYNRIIGMKLINGLRQWDFLNIEDLT